MNIALSRIAEQEGHLSGAMPPCPSALHDLGNGRVEEVPLVNKEYLMKCGVQALYLVASEADWPERFDIETKEGLADLILSKTRGRQPSPDLLPPPIVAPKPLTAREKRNRRGLNRQVKGAVREMRKEDRRQKLASMVAANEVDLTPHLSGNPLPPMTEIMEAQKEELAALST